MAKTKPFTLDFLNGLMLTYTFAHRSIPLDFSSYTHVIKVKHVLKCFAGLKPRFKYGSLKMLVKVRSFKQESFTTFSNFHDSSFNRIFPYCSTDGCLDIT